MIMDPMSHPALYLDRDGVVNRDLGYVYEPCSFQFLDGVFDLCRLAQDNRYKIIVVTNQSGIGRGIYRESDFHALTGWMEARFLEQGIRITGTYHCPHHPTQAKGRYLKDCDCRKPRPGMLLRAAREHHLDLGHSILVGDKLTDLEAAQAAGIRRRYWFVSGKNSVPDRQLVTAMVESHHELMELLKREL